jgi:hypothetical protein
MSIPNGDIKLSSNFELNASVPIDARLLVNDLTERDSITFKYPGLIVYVVSEDTHYSLDADLTTWTNLGINLTDYHSGGDNIKLSSDGGNIELNAGGGNMTLNTEGGNINVDSNIVMQAGNQIGIPSNSVNFDEGGSYMRGGNGSNFSILVLQPAIGNSHLTSQNYDNSSDDRSIEFNTGQSFVLRGADMRYDKDYSSSYTDRSLVDKQYVDTAVSGGGSGVILTGTNGVLIENNFVGLGGNYVHVSDNDLSYDESFFNSQTTLDAYNFWIKNFQYGSDGTAISNSSYQFGKEGFYFTYNNGSYDSYFQSNSNSFEFDSPNTTYRFQTNNWYIQTADSDYSHTMQWALSPNGIYSATQNGSSDNTTFTTGSSQFYYSATQSSNYFYLQATASQFYYNSTTPTTNINFGAGTNLNYYYYNSSSSDTVSFNASVTGLAYSNKDSESALNIGAGSFSIKSGNKNFISDRVLVDSSDVNSLNWDIRELYNSSGNITISYDSSWLVDNSTNLSIAWNDRLLYNSFGYTVNDYEQGILNGSTGVVSLNYSTRKLYNASGTLLLNYNGSNLQTTITPSSGNDITNKTYVDTKASASLAAGKIYIGSGSGVATAQTLSGDVTVTNSGVVTASNTAIIGKVLTGYSAGSGTVSATDSIKSAIQKLDGNIQNIAGLPATPNHDSSYTFNSNVVYGGDTFSNQTEFGVDGHFSFQTNQLSPDDDNIYNSEFSVGNVMQFNTTDVNGKTSQLLFDERGLSVSEGSINFPNYTTTQKNALTDVPNGGQVFDTTLQKMCFYTSTGWKTITSS